MTRRTTFAAIWLAFVIFAAVACQDDSDQPSGGELTVVTTTYPLTFMVERIGGDRVSITQLVKPGVEAHDFEPAPSDVRAIAGSDLFVFNHPVLDGWIFAENSGSTSGSINITDVSILQTVDLELDEPDESSHVEADHDEADQTEDEHDEDDLHDHESGPDAHVWLDPTKAQDQVNRILGALNLLDPEGSTIYTQNAESLIQELQALDESIAARLTGCTLDIAVVSHLAYGHMAERYGFEQIGLAGFSPEFESGPAQIASVIDRINELGIRHILQEPIVSNRLAETVAAETGAELLTLHPLEVRTQAEVEAGTDYFAIMNANAESLHTALQCG